MAALRKPPSTDAYIWWIWDTVVSLKVSKNRETDAPR